MSFGSGPIKAVEKVWGREEWLVNTPHYCCKRLIVKPGFACSFHYHPEKDETFIVEIGACAICVGSKNTQEHLGEGDWKRIRPGVAHKFWNVGPGDCVILEVSTHHDDEDVVRLEPSGKLDASNSNPLYKAT